MNAIHQAYQNICNIIAVTDVPHDEIITIQQPAGTQFTADLPVQAILEANNVTDNF